MAKHLHKKFTDEHITSLLQKYLTHEIELSYILDILKIERRRFFYLLKRYREDPEHFSISYGRKKSTRKISQAIEKNIIEELRIEKRLIEDKNIPIRTYSYIRDQLWSKYRQRISVPTIIDRAKKNNFYFPRPKRKSHDREVLTNYVSELIQHDSIINGPRMQGRNGI